MGHASFMKLEALAHKDQILGLQLLHLGLATLDFRHHHGGVLELPDFVFEVHLNLV